MRGVTRESEGDEQQVEKRIDESSSRREKGKKSTLLSSSQATKICYEVKRPAQNLETVLILTQKLHPSSSSASITSHARSSAAVSVEDTWQEAPAAVTAFLQRPSVPAAPPRLLTECDQETPLCAVEEGTER